MVHVEQNMNVLEKEFLSWEDYCEQRNEKWQMGKVDFRNFSNKDISPFQHVQSLSLIRKLTMHAMNVSPPTNIKGAPQIVDLN